MELCGIVQQALKKAKIPFETKMLNTGTQNRRTGEWWGRLGEDSTLEIVYYIFVFAKDESKAKYLIENCKKSIVMN